MNFSDGIGAGFSFAILGGFLFGGDSGLGVFLGFLFYGHDAGFFRGLHDFAGGGDDGFLVALAAVDFFGVAELLLSLGESGSGVPVSEGDVRDAHGVARLKKLEWSFAFVATHGVFNFGFGRRVDATA